MKTSFATSLKYLLPAVFLLTMRHQEIARPVEDLMLYIGTILVLVGAVYLGAAIAQEWVHTSNMKHDPVIEQMRLIRDLDHDKLMALKEVLNQRLVVTVNLKNPLEYRVMYWTRRGSLTLVQMKEALEYVLNVGDFPDFPVIHGMGEDVFRKSLQAFASLMLDVGLAYREHSRATPYWTVERASDIPKLLLLDKFKFEEE